MDECDIADVAKLMVADNKLEEPDALMKKKKKDLEEDEDDPERFGLGVTAVAEDWSVLRWGRKRKRRSQLSKMRWALCTCRRENPRRTKGARTCWSGEVHHYEGRGRGGEDDYRGAFEAGAEWAHGFMDITDHEEQMRTTFVDRE